MPKTFPTAEHSPCVRSVLTTQVASPASRALARHIAWNWVRGRWPRLVPAEPDRDRTELRIDYPGRALSLNAEPDGSWWCIDVRQREGGSERVWNTRALVARDGEKDVLAVQISCTPGESPPAVVAPPKLLTDWVQQLDLQDAGTQVTALTRVVSDATHLDDVWSLLTSAERALPVVALTSRRNSRSYGVDPRNLAEALQGVAHVTCFTAEMARKLVQRMGKGLAPVAGAVRVYAPGHLDAALHPLIEIPLSSPGDAGSASYARKQLCREICAIGASNSVGAAAAATR